MLTIRANAHINSLCMLIHMCAYTYEYSYERPQHTDSNETCSRPRIQADGMGAGRRCSIKFDHFSFSSTYRCYNGLAHHWMDPGRHHAPEIFHTVMTCALLASAFHMAFARTESFDRAQKAFAPSAPRPHLHLKGFFSTRRSLAA